MKHKFKAIFAAFLAGSAGLLADVTGTNDFVQVQVEQAENSLFSEARLFYDKLGSLKEEDVLYTSKRMIDIPDGKYGAPPAARFVVYGKPNLFLISRLEVPNEPEGRYLLCAIYPYNDYRYLSLVETKTEGWIQGHRLFSIWQKKEGMWKVKLEVSVNNLKESFQYFDPSIVINDNPGETVLALKRIIKSEQETNYAVEQKIIESLQNSKK
jgi:hypothetical protein